MSDIGKNEKPITIDDIYQVVKRIDKKENQSNTERVMLGKKVEALTKSAGKALKNLDSQVSHVLNTLQSELPVISQHDERLNTLTFSLSEKTDELHKKRNGLAFSFRNRLNQLKDEIKNTYLSTLEKNQDLFDALRVNLENYTSKARHLDASKTTTAGESIDFMESKGEGNLRQLYIVSNVNTYRIRIQIDDEIWMDKPYTYYVTHSDYLEGISGFTVAGSYYLSIRNLQFQEEIKITITTPAITIFSEILTKYDIRKEIKETG